MIENISLLRDILESWSPLPLKDFITFQGNKDNVFLQGKDWQVCQRPVYVWDFLYSVFLLALLCITLWDMGLKWEPLRHEAHAVCCATRNKLLYSDGLIMSLMT